MKSSSLQAKLFLIWYRLRYPIRGFIVIGFFVSGYLVWRNLTLPNNVSEAEAIAMTWKVVPESVSNGDTFTLVRGNESMKVKLCGVDAPKPEQPLGIKSRDYLRSLLSPDDGRVNLIEVEKKDDSTIAEVFAGTGKIDENVHVNTEMVKNGMASLDRASSQKCRYAEELDWAEKIAKEDKLGVYKNKNAI
jgi:endonuclease YncB( thermonuclease family)